MVFRARIGASLKIDRLAPAPPLRYAGTAMLSEKRLFGDFETGASDNAFFREWFA